MRRNSVFRYLFFTCACLGVVLSGQRMTAQEVDSGSANAATETEKITFSRIPADQVRTEFLHWLAATGAAPDVLQRVTQMWADDAELTGLSGEELLDLLINTFAEVDTSASRLLQESYGSGPVETPVFDGIRQLPIYQNQIRQFLARWLVQHRYYDEALPLLKKLVPDEVVDPAGLLFYRAVCEAQLLMRIEALDSLSLLLNNTLDVPARFRVVAEMLHKDLEEQDDDGMERVARLMRDVERRLDLGRSGEKTQEQEDAVVAALDKLLEQMEQQNQQQNGGGGNGSQDNQSGQQAAQQSRVKGTPTAGDADRKKLREKGKWGMLDQKAEARVRELIRDRFPSNFLDQIGRYTRRLAEQKK